jgi:hypothetical protein
LLLQLLWDGVATPIIGTSRHEWKSGARLLDPASRLWGQLGAASYPLE